MLENLPPPIRPLGAISPAGCMRPRVVVKQDDLALSIWPCLLESLVYSIQLGHIKILHSFAPLKHTPQNETLTSHLTQIILFLGWNSCLTIVFACLQGPPFLPLLHTDVQVPLLISCQNPVQESLFMTLCCSISCEMLRSNLKVVFLLLLTTFAGTEVLSFWSNPTV